ncbi:hypothetical protein VTO73DRAFT_7621 [Trametes versicolor]
MGLPAIDNTLGAVFIGTVLGCILYGLIVYQVYRYNRLFPEDPLFLKGLVLVISVFETLHTALWILVGYEYGITHYFDFSNLVSNHWYTTLTILVAELTGLTNPIFYARQVYFAAPRYRWIVALAVIAMFGGLGFSIGKVSARLSTVLDIANLTIAIAAATVKGLQSPSLDDFATFNWIVCSAYGCTVFAEILLASTLIWWLLLSKSGFARTNSVVSTLVTYVIHTGLLNTIFGLLVFVFALVYPRKLIYTGISIVGIKLCSISVLAVLNSRASLSALMLQQTTTTNATTSELAFPSRNSALTRTVRDIERDGTLQISSPLSSGARDPTHIRSQRDSFASREELETTQTVSRKITIV